MARRDAAVSAAAFITVAWGSTGRRLDVALVAHHRAYGEQDDCAGWLMPPPVEPGLAPMNMRAIMRSTVGGG
jgi:hypothetical protein